MALKLLHYMRKENSGLARCTLELAKYEEKLGHQVVIKQPQNDMPMYGVEGEGADIELVHSQLPAEHYYNNKPKAMWQHGEPLSSVGNGVSMKAICDLANRVDFFMCMRKREWPIWNSIKRTYLVRKGIDLDVYKPMPGITEKLEGEPSVLYYENMRGMRNPLYLIKAMEIVWQKLPKARLHIFNVTDPKMKETFQSVLKACKYWTFLRSMEGPVNDVNLLLNRVDIVVSCLYPLYARSIEAFGSGKGFICPGYDEHEYPFACELDPISIADTIIRMWENYGQVNFRQWAIDHHNVEDTVRESVKIYERYI